MPKRKEVKSGRLSLRVPPVLHQELTDIADALGLDVNGLVNMLVRRGLPQARFEANELLKVDIENRLTQSLTSPQRYLYTQWRTANPTRAFPHFLGDLIKLNDGEEVTFENGRKVNRIPDDWRLNQ